MIAEKDIYIGDSLAEAMECLNVNNDDIYRLLNDEGDIDFTRSKTEGNPKIYLFQGKKLDQDITITYALKDSTAEVIDFEYPGEGCVSTKSNENKTIVPVPEFTIISLLEQNEFRILNKAKCQLKCYGISEDLILGFHRASTNMAELSQPQLTPNPIYWMKGKLMGKEFEVKYVIGENRSRIAEIVGPQTCDCNE
ncbi:MAG: hypothetical protein ABJG99_01095 [Crocinitomicaceae bacterium]